MTSWQAICENPRFKDLPYKIETNRFDQIIMSPSYLWHGDFQASIASLLKERMRGGRVVTECAIDTTDGTKVADVAWISAKLYKPHRNAFSLPVAPEICVEIVSIGNTRSEMEGKKELYLGLGAKEVWLCDDDGRLEFFTSGSAEALRKSRLCPAFPAKIKRA